MITMKHFKILPAMLALILLSSFKLDNLYNIFPTDDTATVQAAVSSGSLPAHHAPYHISSTINLTHRLNGNGDTVYYTPSTGNAFTFNTANVKLSNITIIGPSDAALSGGCTGLYLPSAAHDTIDHVRIKTFRGNGIVGVNCDYVVFTNSKISDCNYSGAQFVPGMALHGGILSLDTIDRSMFARTLVSQACLLIRGASATLTYPNWTVNNNLLLAPYNPSDPAATEECFELRFCPYSRIYNNVIRKGTIGISVVASNYVKVTGNTIDSCNSEAIEFVSDHCYANANIINHQLRDGYLIDGPSGSHYDTLATMNVQNCAGNAIEIYKLSDNILITGGTITSPATAIYIWGSHVTICSVNLTGTGSNAKVAVSLDSSPGYVTMCGGTVTGFTNNAFHVYWNGLGTTDYLEMVGVTLGSTPHGLGTLVTNGGKVGTHIQVN